MARLMERYKKEIVPRLAEKLGRKNVLSLPKLEKIVLNMGIGRALQDKNRLEKAVDDLTQIAGQKAVVTKARQSIAGFRLRQGYNIGCKVTLRHKRMYEFLDRLISIALPRIRDFRGINPKSFDGHGNYSLGFAESWYFPKSTRTKCSTRRVWTSRLSRRPTAMTKRASCCDNLVCLSGRTRGSFMSAEAKLVRFHRQLKQLDEDKRSSEPKLRPRDKIRIRFRCRLCGRPRSVYRKFGICRICFRDMASSGLIPGVTKASW